MARAASISQIRVNDERTGLSISVIRKRPLAVFCALCVLVLAIVNVQRGSDEDSLFCKVLQLLEKETDGSGRLTVRGTVTDCSAVPNGIRISMNQISTLNTNLVLPSELKITFTNENDSLAPGDQIEVTGTIREYEPAANPGQFDAQTWYFSQKTICALTRTEIRMLNSGSGSIIRSLYLFRKMLRHSMQNILGDRAARMMAAVSLGEKSWLEQEWKTIYQEGGISHILAISGLHITMVGMAFYRFLRKLGLRISGASIASGVLVAGYVLMTGAGISALRAGLMFGIWLGAQVCGRKYDTITGTGIAALILSLAFPGCMRQSSFLLSFSAVLSMGILMPVLSEQFCGSNGGVSAVMRILIPGFSIWLGTLPWTLTFFYQTGLWSILVNLVVIPLMSVILPLGFAAAVAGMALQPLGVFLAAPAEYLFSFFEWLCELERTLPEAVLVLGKPEIRRIILFYGTLFLTIFISIWLKKNRHRIWQGCLWIACGIICIWLMSVPGSSELQITDLDVGQGDCALVELPGGTNCLIDGGSSSKSEVWENVISQCIKRYGIRTLDYIFLSHADQDHISGVEEFLKQYETGFGNRNIHGITLGCLVLPLTGDETAFADLIRLAEDQQITVRRMKQGDRVSSEDWTIDCLWPNAKSLTGDSNQDSMVLRLTYEKFSMLFTGDLEREGELRLAAAGENLQCNVLKVGHHGSAGASQTDFLERVKAKHAVISCGKNNSYGHPSPETVGRLEACGCRIWNTAEIGAVTIRSDGSQYSIDGYR